MRKTHTKSRHGCAQCKGRHVKCNEQQPVCKGCQRMRIQCSFSTPTQSSTPLASSSQPVTIGHLGEPPPLRIAELELMHNFTTKTAITILPEPARRDKFVDGFVRLGFTQQHLLHTMMALSALHLYSQDSSRKELVSRASAHHNVALRLVRPIIAHANEENALSLSAFSGLTAVYSSAEVTLQANEIDHRYDLVKGFLSSSHLSRGIMAVMGLPSFREAIRNSWVGPILKYQDHRDLINQSIEEEYSAPRKALLDLVESEVNEEDDRRACHFAATRCLKYMLALLSQGEDHECVRLIQTWSVEIGKDFMLS